MKNFIVIITDGSELISAKNVFSYEQMTTETSATVNTEKYFDDLVVGDKYTWDNDNITYTVIRLQDNAVIEHTEKLNQFLNFGEIYIQDKGEEVVITASVQDSSRSGEESLDYDSFCHSNAKEWEEAKKNKRRHHSEGSLGSANQTYDVCEVENEEGVIKIFWCVNYRGQNYYTFPSLQSFTDFCINKTCKDAVTHETEEEQLQYLENIEL